MAKIKEKCPHNSKYLLCYHTKNNISQIKSSTVTPLSFQTFAPKTIISCCETETIEESKFTQ